MADSEVVVGYLITLCDGFECRLAPDLTRAQVYAVRMHARSIEPMYVRRPVVPAGADDQDGRAA
jgi:hypothetical protein